MSSMPHRWSVDVWWRIGLLLLATVCGACATGTPWYRYVYQEYHREPAGGQHDHRQCDQGQHHRHDEHHHPHHQGGGAGRGEYGGGGYQEEEEYGGGGPHYEENGCACLLYAERTLVSRSENKSSWHSCDGWGLERCGRQYCDQLLRDEDARFRILQNACDTLGREIVTPLYLRRQVCGDYGPYEDVLLPEDLCCRRGRPSDTC